MHGLNVRGEFADLIVSGRKKVETRTYAPPSKLFGKRIAIIKTGIGPAAIVGSVKLSRSFQYDDKDDFDNDIDRHLVDPRSEFYWNKKPKYGWRLVDPIKYEEPVLAPKKKGIVWSSNLMGCK